MSPVTVHNGNHRGRGGKGGPGRQKKTTLNANCYGSFWGKQATSLKHSWDQAAHSPTSLWCENESLASKDSERQFSALVSWEPSDTLKDPPFTGDAPKLWMTQGFLNFIRYTICSARENCHIVRLIRGPEGGGQNTHRNGRPCISNHPTNCVLFPYRTWLDSGTGLKSLLLTRDFLSVFPNTLVFLLFWIS